MNELKFKQLIREAYKRLDRVNELLDIEEARLAKTAKKAA